MDELLSLVITNAPNLIGFVILAAVQWRTTEMLRSMLDEQNRRYFELIKGLLKAEAISPETATRLFMDNQE